MTPTSSYPYATQGPIDFSPYAFVVTVQEEVLVPNASGSFTLQSVTVRQTYDPVIAFWSITVIGVLVLLCTGVIAWFVQKRSKTVAQAFNLIP